MARFYFVRHGDAYDEMGIQLEDYALNNNGRIQALQLARRLRDNKFDAMYCSKIKRSMQTCEIVNDVHKMDVIYNSKLNEVGGEIWPQPGVIAEPESLASYDKALQNISGVFKKLKEDHKNQEVIIFTHGNWIRVLLSHILAKGSHETFFHFVIHNTALTIIDVNEVTGFESIITVSDAGHTHLYDSHI
jgi:broad specificity phosphatase PhoE